jgi:hypothetical protein
MDDSYCFINKNSLSKEICNEIIKLFESNKDKHDGLTASGLNKNVKDTTDLVIDKNDGEWKEIYRLLEKELKNNILRYVKKANNENNDLKQFNRFQRSLSFETIQVQKYVKKTGKYIYHDDSRTDGKKVRKITFLWYLNDVTDGGETEFQSFKVRPEAGKLILFPSLWTYPHRGNMPISDDKYIMTGWLDEELFIF